MQEPLYYVLENNSMTCKHIPCKADASNGPPSLELSSPSHDQLPAYQDITELPSKANENISHRCKGERSSNKDDSAFSNPNTPQDNKY